MADYRDFGSEKSRDPLGLREVYSLAVRKALLAILALVMLGTAALAAASRRTNVGYFAPRFTPDGEAVVVMVRDARAAFWRIVVDRR